jgi:hypothetical protein
MNPKKPLPSDQSRAAVSWRLEICDKFKALSSKCDQKPLLDPPNVVIERLGEVMTCSVLAAPNSRAAVSLSYLIARVQQNVGKTLSLAIVRMDNPL